METVSLPDAHSTQLFGELADTIEQAERLRKGIDDDTSRYTQLLGVIAQLEDRIFSTRVIVPDVFVNAFAQA